MGRYKKTKIRGEEYDELLKRALKPFKPTLTDEDVRKHEEEIRERSLNAAKGMREALKGNEKETLLTRASFEKHFSI